MEKNRICVPPRVERGKQKERQRMEVKKKKVDSEIKFDYIKANLFLRLSEMKIFKIIKKIINIFVTENYIQ